MRITKALITAGGRGTRQYPATQAIQKALIPVVDRDGITKPTLQIIIEEALASGIEEIGVVTSPEDEEAFRGFFQGMDENMRPRFATKPWGLTVSDRLADIGARLTTIVQPSPEGYGHAVWCARDWVCDDPFLLLLGDHVYVSREERPTMRQVLDMAERCDRPVFAVQRTPESRLRLYGTVGGDPIRGQPGAYNITSVVEKPTVDFARAHLRVPGLPEDQYLCFFGMHALPPEIFDCLDELVAADQRTRGEIQFAAAQAMFAERVPTIAIEVNGDRYDMGVPLGLIETQIALALNGRYAEEVKTFWRAMTQLVAP
ncbi:MAG TPA: sugar phosphate nucleotidyltransferase [Armatimonadota bacterium]|jgi:UTP--glucose-1-phosphate uridylyltransferase